MVEPPGTDRDVDFRRHPVGAVGTSGRHARVGRMAGVEAGQRDGVPRRLERDPFFIAHPAHVGPCIAEHDGAWLQLANQLPRVLPVVVRRTVDPAALARPSVVAIPAVGAVEPHLEERPVLGEQLAQLAAVIVDVGRASVVGVVAIPGREIDAELEPELAARARQVADDIAPAVLPRAAFDRVRGEAARPQREAVVVLGSEDQSLHAGVSRDRGPLARVERGRIEGRLGLVTVAPLLVGEGIHREVDEAVELALVPGELPRCRDRVKRRRRRDARLRRQDNARQAERERARQPHARE